MYMYTSTQTCSPQQLCLSSCSQYCQEAARHIHFVLIMLKVKVLNHYVIYTTWWRHRAQRKTAQTKARICKKNRATCIYISGRILARVAYRGSALGPPLLLPPELGQTWYSIMGTGEISPDNCHLPACRIAGGSRGLWTKEEGPSLLCYKIIEPCIPPSYTMYIHVPGQLS